MICHEPTPFQNDAPEGHHGSFELPVPAHGPFVRTTPTQALERPWLCAFMFASSLFAPLWLAVVLGVLSPNVVTVAEAAVTVL